jgi:hypothetical protein
MLQFLAVPGKKGRARKQLGNVGLNQSERWVSIPIAPPMLRTEPDGSRSSIVTPLIDPSFDLSKFRRALHRVCLNLLAFQDGVQRVMAPEFDPVRTYVRRGWVGEEWAYSQLLNVAEAWPRKATIYFPRISKAEIVSFSVGGATFAVDLLNTGLLRSWGERGVSGGMDFVDPSYSPPALEVHGGKRRYRVRIMIDE